MLAFQARDSPIEIAKIVDWDDVESRDIEGRMQFIVLLTRTTDCEHAEHTVNPTCNGKQERPGFNLKNNPKSPRV